VGPDGLAAPMDEATVFARYHPSVLDQALVAKKLAATLGLETILGAFIAGVLLRFVDGDRMMTHPQFRLKLEAIGYGVFIPIFFITSGLQFDLAALFTSPSTILRVPIFLVALLLVRGMPALLYRPLVGSRRAIVAGLLQATSLSFIVAASQIGLQLGLLTKATGAALIAAGLLSILNFPLLALTLLRYNDVSTIEPNEKLSVSHDSQNISSNG